MKTVGGAESLGLGITAYDVYLFDIDGTLINCSDATHYFAFCEALAMLSGRPLTLEGVVAHGNTDVGILRDALALAGVPEESWRPRLAEARELMSRFVAEKAAELRVEVLPSVMRVLEELRGCGALLGVATGNLEAIGRLKLSSAGLLGYFDFGGYSDQFEFRKDVFRHALELARSAAGSDARVCVVGDTPEDVRAARANGVDVVAVATGIYSAEELRREKPTACVATLAEFSL